MNKILKKANQETSPMRGLLYMSYGTPRKEENLVGYLTSIRGRLPNDREVEGLRHRYRLIGQFQDGMSPLNRMMTAQGQDLVEILNRRAGSNRWTLYEGYKHMEPSIEDALQAMYDDGIHHCTAIVAAPFDSNLGTGDYRKRAQAKAEAVGLRISFVGNWWQEDAFIDYWVGVLEGLILQQDWGMEPFQLIFSAHSLPVAALKMGDSYMESVQVCANRIMDLLRHSDTLEQMICLPIVAWQSAPLVGQWLNPTVDQVIEKALENGLPHIVVAPIGFVCDHLEVLYDDDIVYKEQIERGGATYHRPVMPNDAPLLIQAMANAVEGEG